MIKKILRSLYYLFQTKQGAELRYWKKCHKIDGGRFTNEHYERLMLGMAEEKNDAWLMDKAVGDFGCGPRGTLTWARSAAQRYGIDILAEKYLRCFGSDMAEHNMTYITSTESHIPLPEGCLDVLYTLNALDHVADLETMCRELIRILKPGGLLIGSFNLNEPAHKAEPQTLTEELLKEHLFKDFEIISWKVSAPSPTGYKFEPLLTGQLIDPKSKPSILWVKAIKKA